MQSDVTLNTVIWTISSSNFEDEMADNAEANVKLASGEVFKLYATPQMITPRKVILQLDLHHGNSSDQDGWWPPVDVVLQVALLKAGGTKCYSEEFLCHFTPQVTHSTVIYSKEAADLNSLFIIDHVLMVHCLLEKKVTRNSADYLTLLHSGLFSDLKLCIGESEFAVHRAVLATRSPGLAQLFREKDQDKLDISDAPSVAVFRLLLESIYSGSMPSLEQSKYAEELLVVADKYEMNDLKFHCAQWLVEHLTTDSAVRVLLLADKYQLVELKSCCIKYIISKMSVITATKVWKQLELHSELLDELYEELVK